jgi:RecB family exonuclease
VTSRVPALQRRRLIRARNLSQFQRALVDLALTGDPVESHRRVMILPTHASIEILRQTLEAAAGRQGRAAIILPELLTRDGWIARLHQALPGASPMLTPFERELLMDRAARAAAHRGRRPRPPFEIRPRVVTEMVTLYDELRRRQRSVGRFSRVLFDQLRVERGTDRGSDSLIHQTCFLGFAFLGYERRVAASGGVDEHDLRRRLIETQPVLPFDRIVVAVADHPSDPRGLWPADFDLLGRLRGVAELDVVVTDQTHDAGFRERIEQELPGISEMRVGDGEPAEASAPVLIRPPGGDPETLCFVHRDREEELRDVARGIRGRAQATGHELRESCAIVFQRPLPYLYMAQQVLGDARVPFQAFDALPLAAEPYAALLDLVLAAASTGVTRETAAALLRSPLLQFDVDGLPLALEDVAALNGVLTDRRVTGEADTYLSEVERYFGGRAYRNGADAVGAVRAARVAATVRDALQPYRDAPTASARISAIADFLRHHERPSAPGEVRDEGGDRQSRARAAVHAVLGGLADAFARHDDRPCEPDALTASIHHGIEARTFASARATGGVHLVDAIAARFGEFDHVHLVGLVETDWPERARRSIFYTSGLLQALGWPQETDQTRAQQAAFRDLIGLPARTLQLHGFQLEGDAVVALSPMVDIARGLTAIPGQAGATRLVFADEVLTMSPPIAAGLAEDAARWLELRVRRPPLTDRRYGGFVAPQASQVYRVSRVDRYVDCPFKYFSENVLGLPEEREEASGLTPLERGTLVHELFERFYRTWHAERGCAVSPATLPHALELFGRLTREALSQLPEADRALEETRLLGSIVARGMAERVFELEANAGGEVVDRLVEFELRGAFSFPQLSGFKQRTIDIRGKADRIDLLRDDGLRIVDYKLSRLPDTASSVQLAVYAHAARQALEARDGRPHPVIEAMYVAFGDERKTEGKLGGKGETVGMAIEARASEFAAAIEQIEAGQFPPNPKRPGDCQWCRYAGVCRKEYVVEEAPREQE